MKAKKFWHLKWLPVEGVYKLHIVDGVGDIVFECVGVDYYTCQEMCNLHNLTHLEEEERMRIHSEEGTIYIFKKALVTLKDKKIPADCLIDPDAPLIQEEHFAKFYCEDGSYFLIPLERIAGIEISTENFEFDDATSRKL